MQHQQHALKISGHNKVQHIPVPFKHSLQNVLLPLQLEVTLCIDRTILITYIMKIKVKLSLYMSHDDVAALMLNLHTSWRWMVSFTISNPATFPWAMPTDTHWIGGTVGPKAGLYAEIPCACWESNRNPSLVPPTAQPLYWLHYPDSRYKWSDDSQLHKSPHNINHVISIYK
jgi:hypothetical protein